MASNVVHSRAELQKLAKEHGIRANATTAFILSELTKLNVLPLQNKENLPRKRKDREQVDPAIKKKKKTKKPRKSGMSDAVLKKLECPICLLTMRGHIHQVCGKLTHLSQSSSYTQREK